MNTQILELISIVANNFEHIQQLGTLIRLLEKSNTYSDKMLTDEIIVAKTTQNSHYNYRLFGHRKYQNPLNHIDSFIYDECTAHKNTILYETLNPEEINWDK